MGTLANLSSLWRTLGYIAPAGAEGRLLLQPPLLLGFVFVPCVLLLFCLNCFLLLHRLPGFSGRGKSKRGAKPQRPHNKVNGHRGACLDPTCAPNSGVALCNGCRVSSSSNKGSEPMLVLGKGPPGYLERAQFHNPCHWRVSECRSCPRPLVFSPSMSCSQRFWTPTHRATHQEIPKGQEHQVEDGWGEWFQNTRSFCGNNTWHNAAPPNSPETVITPGVTPKVRFTQKTSTQRKTQGDSTPFTPLNSINFEGASFPCLEDSALISPSGCPFGPGLDSDFGVSAGVSMHVLSSDTDNSFQSWTSGMEWDYYDPCYMRRNRHRPDLHQSHHLPVLCSKQFWV